MCFYPSLQINLAAKYIQIEIFPNKQILYINELISTKWDRRSIKNHTCLKTSGVLTNIFLIY